MSERWTFGVEPLAQTVELAALLRRVAGLAVTVESDQEAVAHLIAELRAAEAALAEAAPRDLSPRIGRDPQPEQRVYLDHSRNIGDYNPAFADYTIVVEGNRATGDVEFPLMYEGPSGLVHGGVLATFFDCVIQHHNCDLGEAGKTASLLVEYRRPTPIREPLRFVVDRETEERWITSTARLLRADEVLCSASVKAVRSERATLPVVSPRREPS